MNARRVTSRAHAWMRRMWGEERAFTLPEVLVAAVIITVGLTAIASGFQYALSGVEVGKSQSTAVFLAEQKLEQIKADAMTNFAAMGPYNTEAYGDITGYPRHRRTVTVTTATATTKLVSVSVFYQLQGSYGVALQEREVRLDAIVAQRS
jgi:prepilin-type N-terminal cleavage/methylation domain-containing protein